MHLIDATLGLLIPALVLLHLGLAPYTKVEESLNIQAAHDVLVYGAPTSNVQATLAARYDHFTFPGAVPRTFVGPVMLAALADPLVRVVGLEHAQFIVRALLGLFNAGCLVFFAASVRRAFGPAVGRWYLLLQASQFHVIFYASRPLPNMFAFGLTTLASAFLLPSPIPKSTNRRHRLAVSLLVFAAVVFRAEIAILLGAQALYLLLYPLTSLERLVAPFAASCAVALALTVPLDSYFWQRPLLWPELFGFYYNAVLGSSSHWGVSPWHYYFTSALPRLLANPLIIPLLIPLALRHPAFTAPAAHLVVPNLLFIAIYSLQPHKEARFIFYVVPPLTAAAALGAASLSIRWSKSPVYRAGTLLTAASIPLTFAASALMLLVSALNYPGGEALAQLRAIVAADAGYTNANAVVPVHADVLACMTGVTLFGTAMPGETLAGRRAHAERAGREATGTPRPEPASAFLSVDKTEDDPELLRSPLFWSRFAYVLAEDPAKVMIVGPGSSDWDVIGVVYGYAGVEILRPGQGPDRDRDGDLDQGEDDEDEVRGEPPPPVLGKGAALAGVRDRVRRYTGGWWVGPRMEPRISILRRVRIPDGAAPRVEKATTSQRR